MKISKLYSFILFAAANDADNCDFCDSTTNNIIKALSTLDVMREAIIESMYNEADDLDIEPSHCEVELSNTDYSGKEWAEKIDRFVILGENSLLDRLVEYLNENN